MVTHCSLYLCCGSCCCFGSCCSCSSCSSCCCLLLTGVHHYGNESGRIELCRDTRPRWRSRRWMGKAHLLGVLPWLPLPSLTLCSRFLLGGAAVAVVAVALVPVHLCFAGHLHCHLLQCVGVWDGVFHLEKKGQGTNEKRSQSHLGRLHAIGRRGQRGRRQRTHVGNGVRQQCWWPHLNTQVGVVWVVGVVTFFLG